MKSKTIVLAVLLALSLPIGQVLAAEKKYDVLALPAVPSELASKSLIYALKKFHNRYFATGHHGHILYSDDGENWQQAEVPVRSSILDIAFPTPELGWAVGHEGVILHSGDGGKTWVKQYDGLRYGTEGVEFYKKLAEQEPENDYYAILLEELEFAVSQGADKPLFGVRFHTPEFGHAMGAYGMILRTTDGGKNWEHALHSMENDSFYHVFDYAALPETGKFFLTGEAGLLMVGDIRERTGKRITAVPWEGSFFTAVATTDNNVVMGGLRGRMFHTANAGESWTVIEKPPTSSIVDSTRLEDGRLIAITIGGKVLMSTDNGFSFTEVPIGTGGRLYAVSEGPQGTLLLGGPNGIAKVPMPQ